MKCLLLSADTFELTSESTGELISGCTLFYVNKYRDASGQILGLKPTKISATVDIFKDIKKSGITLPAIADIEIGSRPGAQNKATVTVFGVEIIEPFEIFQ